MYRFGPDYFFITSLCILVCGAVAVAVMIRTKTGVTEHPSDFTLASSASAQAALQLDPRAEDESGSSNEEVIDESGSTTSS
jgi:hypothetical protein